MTTRKTVSNCSCGGLLRRTTQNSVIHNQAESGILGGRGTINAHTNQVYLHTRTMPRLDAVTVIINVTLQSVTYDLWFCYFASRFWIYTQLSVIINATTVHPAIRTWSKIASYQYQITSNQKIGQIVFKMISNQYHVNIISPQYNTISMLYQYDIKSHRIVSWQYYIISYQYLLPIISTIIQYHIKSYIISFQII